MANTRYHAYAVRAGHPYFDKVLAEQHNWPFDKVSRVQWVVADGATPIAILAGEHAGFRAQVMLNSFLEPASEAEPRTVDESEGMAESLQRVLDQRM